MPQIGKEIAVGYLLIPFTVPICAGAEYINKSQKKTDDKLKFAIRRLLEESFFEGLMIASVVLLGLKTTKALPAKTLPLHNSCGIQ